MLDVAQEAATMRTVIRRHARPAPAWQISNRAFARPQKLPELLGAIGARKPAPQTDDRDRFGLLSRVNCLRPREVFLRQVRCEPCDCWRIIKKRWRQRSLKPFCQIGGDRHHAYRIEAKISERLLHVDIAGWPAQLTAQPGHKPGANVLSGHRWRRHIVNREGSLATHAEALDNL